MVLYRRVSGSVAFLPAERFAALPVRCEYGLEMCRTRTIRGNWWRANTGFLTTPRPEGRGFQPRGPGFLFHSRSPKGGPLRSYISSAGSNGKTCRQDVLRGVDVPVVPGAAGRALPRPGLEREFREQVPARRAGLGRRVPAVDHDHVPPRPGRLVLQHPPESTPPAVGDGLGERMVADHAGDVQVFDHDHVVVADQAGGGAVQEIGAGGADFPVYAGHLGPGFGLVRGLLLAASQPPLVAAEVTFPPGHAPAVRASSPP